MNNESTNTVLTDKVEKFKVIARDTLRMNLISPRLSKIADLENRITDINKEIEGFNHDILVENYEISKLDTEHPDYADHKGRKEDSVKCDTECIDNCNKAIEELNKAITEQKDGIAKIESGETKVSLEDLNDLVIRMTKQAALDQISE
jgi:uncharacterized coiled-coil protein SlyX